MKTIKLYKITDGNKVTVTPKNRLKRDTKRFQGLLPMRERY